MSQSLKVSVCKLQLVFHFSDEGGDYQTFRIGLFGLDKLKDVDAAVKKLENALNQVA